MTTSEIPARLPLLADLNDDQQILIKEIAEVFLIHQDWPTWQYIEETLERKNLDAGILWASLPREYSHNYGYVWPPNLSTPTALQRIGLTIAGLGKVPIGQTYVNNFLALVRAIGNVRSKIRLEPFADTKPAVTREDIVSSRRPFLTIDKSLLAFLDHEPATWNCQVVTSSEDDWSIELAPSIRRFADVTSLEDYLARMRDLLVPTETPAIAVVDSPFTLPASIDYLDVVWRLRFDKKPLVVPPGVERSAKLAFDAATQEEVDNRLSVLAEVLKNLQVPGVDGIGGHPLQRLGPFLARELPSDSHERVDKAIQLLDAARMIRTAGQHHSAQSEMVAAYSRLGLSYPVVDWSAAWQQIQRVVATALNDIRDEIYVSIS